MADSILGQFRVANVPRAYWGKDKSLKQYGGGPGLIKYLDSKEFEDILLGGQGFHLHGVGRHRPHLMPMFARALVVRKVSVYYGRLSTYISSLARDVEFEDDLAGKKALCIDDINDETDAVRALYTEKEIWDFEDFISNWVENNHSVFTSGDKPMLESGWFTMAFRRRLDIRLIGIEVK